MARKTKDEVLEKKDTKKTTSKAAEKKKTAVKSVVKKAETKKVVKTSSTSTTKKTPSKKTTLKNSKTVKATATKSKDKDTPKKSKVTTKPKTTKSTSTTSKEKKTVAKSKVAKSSVTNKDKKEPKKTTRSKTAKKVSSKIDSKSKNIDMPEYYDLPYRYNNTVVKVLAQNPNTLFIYWDISDEDRLNLENKYGKDIFYKTHPVLAIHNLTDNYTFEIDINDFANNWYVNVNDTKCKYSVELGRRTNNNDFINTPINYLNIAFSNTIEIPNDHILFFKQNDKIYFKNIKTNKITAKIINAYTKNLKGIYKAYNLSEANDRFDLKNPSSQNPTSTLL